MLLVAMRVVQAAALLAGALACTGSDERTWKGLAQRTAALTEEGRYEEAVGVGQQALELAERSFGPEHPDVATSLNRLAGLYRVQGRYGEAAPLYQRALAIRETALGPEHPNVADTLENLAGLYRELGRAEEAAALAERARLIRQRGQ